MRRSCLGQSGIYDPRSCSVYLGSVSGTTSQHKEIDNKLIGGVSMQTGRMVWVECKQKQIIFLDDTILHLVD